MVRALLRRFHGMVATLITPLATYPALSFVARSCQCALLAASSSHSKNGGHFVRAPVVCFARLS